jgi:hypothetical protein
MNYPLTSPIGTRAASQNLYTYTPRLTRMTSLCCNFTPPHHDFFCLQVPMASSAHPTHARQTKKRPYVKLPIGDVALHVQGGLPVTQTTMFGGQATWRRLVYGMAKCGSFFIVSILLPMPDFPDKLDPLVDCGDVRQASLPGQWTTDYVVDACDFPGAPGPCGTSGLTLFLSSNSCVDSLILWPRVDSSDAKFDQGETWRVPRSPPR